MTTYEPERPLDTDELEFARETLGPDASLDEVENLAWQRRDRDAGEGKHV